MNAVSTIRDTVMIDAPVRDEAARVLASAAGEHVGAFSVLIGGRSVPLPEELSHFLGSLLKRAAAGGVTTVRSMPDELTTTAAASMLGISRPTLMKLIADDRIPAHRVGSHSRLLTSDVLAHLAARRQTRAKAFDSLRSLPDDLGGA